MGSRTIMPTDEKHTLISPFGLRRNGLFASVVCSTCRGDTEWYLTTPSFFDTTTDRSPFCLIFRPRDSETAISVFKALESRQKLGFQRRRSTFGGGPARAAPKPNGRKLRITIAYWATADVSLRRLQMLRVAPGETLRWTFGTAGGEVRADAAGALPSRG